MSYIIVDVEADGEIPYVYSMVCFAAIIVDEKLDKKFYGTTKPISNNYNLEALSISGFSRDEHLDFADPSETMSKFEDWIKANNIGTPIFLSDNLAFDWQWINWYFHYYLGRNPFGFSGRRIGDLWCGYKNNMKVNKEWKRFRITKHDHNPLNDVTGNAEALLKMKSLGLNLIL